jgi:hypothetical protein
LLIAAILPRQCTAKLKGSSSTFFHPKGHRMKANFRGTTRRACITAAVGLITDCGVIR